MPFINPLKGFLIREMSIRKTFLVQTPCQGTIAACTSVQQMHVCVFFKRVSMFHVSLQIEHMT
jgi:hypothetical protein